MSDEARAEAERRYRLDPESQERAANLAELNSRVDAANGFIAGAEWEASRKVEAPADEPTRIEYHARRGGRTEAMIDRLLSVAGERGIRVEVVYPDREVTDDMVARAAEALHADDVIDCMDNARAALEAALGGGDHE